MKKVHIYSVVLVVIGAVLFAGCKKYLETLPDNRIDFDDPANITVDNVASLLVNAYPKGNYMGFCETMSDNVADKQSSNLQVTPANYGPYFYYDLENMMSQDMPGMYWAETYKAIAQANQALYAISKATNPNDFKALKGEALVARAYAHFMLVNLFSKTYDPATASSDPGIPYVTAMETTAYGQYQRKTVAYVYDAIRKDLLEGMPLISDGAYTVPKYHFTKAATNAFAARYYLFRQQYDSAVYYANRVFGSNPNNIIANMRPWLTVYRSDTYNQLLQTYTSPSEKANLLLVETISNWANYSYYRYGFTSALNDSIYKKNVAGGLYAYRMAGQDDYHLNLAKFYPHFVQSGINSTTGLYYTTIPLLTTEEVLLNRAEAYAYLGNFTSAISDLNVFASQRIYNGTKTDSTSTMIPYDPVKNNISVVTLESYYKTGDTKTNIIKAVLDFKRAEFCFEGMRWFDVLRHKITVNHKYATGQVSDTTIVLGPNDKRRLLQIPDAATLSGLELNPRDE